MLGEEPLDLEVWVRIPAMENSSRTGICFKICCSKRPKISELEARF